jgi:transcriptional regulator with XRE-family HTH domain
MQSKESIERSKSKKFNTMSNFSDLGKKFRDKRRLQKLTIQEISEKTLINLSYINAIEEGKFSEFPAEAFARAYFKKYAQFLDLDVSFPDEAFNAPKSNKAIDGRIDIKPSILDKVLSKQLLALILIFLGLLLVLFFLISNSSNYSEAMIDKAKPLETIEIALAEEVSVFLDNQDSLDATPEVPQVEMNINDYIEPEENNYFQNNPKKALLEMNFLGESWIEIYQADERFIYELFNSGSTFEMTLERPFRIVVGHSKNTELYYEGDKIDLISIANSKNVSVVTFND